MKYVLLVIALVAIYAAFYVVRIYYAAHYSKNPDIVQRDGTFGTGGGTTIKYIAAGDSTAVGEGASTVEKTYPYQIAQALGATKTVQYKNIAVRGAKTSDVIQNQLSQIITYQPDVITISIGANDATHLVSEKQLLDNYKEILTQLTQKTSAKIYITDIPNFTGAKLLPYPFVRLIEWRSSKINPQIEALANSFGRDRVFVVNIHDFGWDKYPDRQATYSVDHFHPSDTGYENWFNAFWNAMKNQ